ncbi:MAG: family 43 glycosylhydrolase [Verrucomicrobia bacterium]|nr:family 43 glycosylhydrolase [Verrucomicrobiota bacterium]
MNQIPGHLFASDPTCRELPDGRFWIFTTHDQCSSEFQAPADYWDNMYSYQAYSTADFVEWRQHGSILSRFDIAWGTANAVWDGDAGIPANGRYYAYIPIRCAGTKGWEFQMAVLVADQPEGPYKDALGRPFLTRAEAQAQGLGHQEPCDVCLSPTVIIADDGSPWLLFGQFRAYMAPLCSDMLGFSGPIRELNISLFSGEAHEFIEGPMLHKVGSRWVFSYMTYKNWKGKPNANFQPDDPEGPYIQVCESDSMFGPFDNPRHWIYPSAPDDCNIQHAMAPWRGRWIVAYHLPWRQGSEFRKMHVTEARLDADQRLLPIYPKADPGLGETSRITYAAHAKRFAQEYSAAQGARLEQGPLKAHHVVFQPGGHIRFDDLDFGLTPRACSVSLEMLSLEGDHPQGSLEIRLDRLDGPLLGSLEPAAFRSEKSVLQTPPVSGRHALYLHLTGSAEPETHPLCRLLSFRISNNDEL